MAVAIFIFGWLIVMAYVVIGNYLYFVKILPGLAHHGLDGSMKILPWTQLKQVNHFLAEYPPESQGHLVHFYVSHIRLITAITLVVEFSVFGAVLLLST